VGAHLCAGIGPLDRPGNGRGCGQPGRDRAGASADRRVDAAGFPFPALISGQTPKSIADAGLITNPVHILDLSLVLPGLIVTAIQLVRRRAVAFVLAPVLMVFSILMTVAIAGMMVAMSVRGFAADYTMAAFFLASAAGCTALLVRYFRRYN
jgi:hypothetical protein